MDRPNRIAKSITGRNGRIGPVAVTPNRLAKWPHWNTATVAPRAAPRLSNAVSAPIAGTTNERNSSISAKKPSETTTSRNMGRASLSTVAKSLVTAVAPPT